MKVRFSTEARSYLAREAVYLKERSTTGAARFQRIVARARRQIETFPDSGYTDSVVSLAGARRMAIDEYLFDYDVIGDVATGDPALAEHANDHPRRRRGFRRSGHSIRQWIRKEVGQRNVRFYRPGGHRALRFKAQGRFVASPSFPKLLLCCAVEPEKSAIPRLRANSLFPDHAPIGVWRWNGSSRAS